MIAIINNYAIPLCSSASAPRNLHNQGVENAIQNCIYSSLIPHFTFNTQLTVNVRYFFISGTDTNISQADYILPRHTNSCLHSTTFSYASSVDVIHPIVPASHVYPDVLDNVCYLQPSCNSEQVIRYAPHCNLSRLIQSIAYQGSKGVLWLKFLTTYFYIYFHTISPYQ